MKVRRLILLGLVAIGLAPGTLVRDRPPPAVFDAGVEVTPVPLTQDRLGALDVHDIWELRSRHALFHGYSGLVATGERQFLAASDAGSAMAFSLASGRPSAFELFRFDLGATATDKAYRDIEALTRDPQTGRIWAAFEGRNIIERRNSDLSHPAAFAPEPMQGWSANSGPEAMARLPDGQFLILGEGKAGFMGKEFPGLKWVSDPLGGGEPVEFTFAAPDNFRPTDMAALPDGRVLILGRRIAWGVPPHFEAVLLVADPAQILPGKSWSGVELARFSPPFPTDNYEGLAVEPSPFSRSGYPVMLTIISDDNAVSYQRTLLLRLQWDGQVPGPGKPAP